MKINLIDLKKQYLPIKEKIDIELEKIFNNCSFIMGDNVKSFEQEFSKYLNVNNSISVGNGTDALVIALKALNIGEGDEVITTPFTFFATAESIARVKAVPVFVDVREDTFNINEDLIEEKITPKTKAILPVHIFGNPCNMEKINEIAKKHNLYVIEDACQAIGSNINGVKIGSLSDIACFSFFPTKNLGCAGDGGMIVTNNDDLATICKAYRTHGSGIDGSKAYSLLNNTESEVLENKGGDNTVYNPLKYFNYLIGYNTRLDEVQAAILRIKLPLIDEYNDSRIELAKYYNEKLKDTKLVLPTHVDNARHVYHLYVVQSEKRDELAAYLKSKDIATGVYYQVPLHLQKAFSYLNYKEGDLPVAEYLSHRTLAIPMYSYMTMEEREYVVQSILEWSKNNE